MMLKFHKNFKVGEKLHINWNKTLLYPVSTIAYLENDSFYSRFLVRYKNSGILSYTFDPQWHEIQTKETSFSSIWICGGCVNKVAFITCELKMLLQKYRFWQSHVNAALNKAKHFITYVSLSKYLFLQFKF